MRILHVEDDSDWFERIVRPNLEGVGRNTVHHAVCSSDAMGILSGQEIDYVILDLAIPLDADGSSPSTSHGQALAHYVRNTYPGTPILILTGQSTEEAAQELEEDDTFASFWDGKRRNLVKRRKKSQLDKAVDLVMEASDALAKLDGLELDLLDAESRQLGQTEKRIIRLFATCSSGAVAAQVRSTPGGLSGSKVLKVTLLDDQGHTVQNALAKIDTAEKIEVEASNYNSHVLRLPVAAFPSHIEQHFAGCGNKKGVFYQLATEYHDNFFNVLRGSDDRAAELIVRLKGLLSNWHSAKTARRTKIRSIRRLLCSDEKIALAAAHMNTVPWEEFEGKEVRAHWSIQHGDLHGANVLVSNDNRPVVIDYGDIGSYPCCLDPITLELSPYFHPGTRDDCELSEKIAERWFDKDRYLELVKWPKTAGELRIWTDENSYLTGEQCAVIYAYCVRQLTYSDTNKGWTISLIKSAINRYG